MRSRGTQTDVMSSQNRHDKYRVDGNIMERCYRANGRMNKKIEGRVQQERGEWARGNADDGDLLLKSFPGTLTYPTTTGREVRKFGQYQFLSV